MERLTTPILPQNEVREDWSTAAGSYQIEIRPEAVDQIKTEIIRGLKALPKRGTEIGGILFGSIHKSGGNRIFEIQQVLAVATEYRFGPSFRLSESDEKVFERSISAWPDRTAVGWYRSNTRPPREAVPDDHGITAKYFPSDALFLFLKPQFTGEIGATAHVTGAEPHDFDFGRFSFLDQLLNNPIGESDLEAVPAVFDTQGRQRASAIEKLGVETGEMSLGEPLPQDPLERLSPKAILSVSAAAAVLIAIAGWLFLNPPASRPLAASPDKNGQRDASSTLGGVAKVPPASSASPSAVPLPTSDKLDLRAEFRGRSLMVQWNTQAVPVITATGGEFTLQQGSSKRTVALDTATLQSGGLLLQPTAADLTLLLKVQSPIGDKSQSLRIVALPKADTAVTKAQQPEPNRPTGSSPVLSKEQTVAVAIATNANPPLATKPAATNEIALNWEPLPPHTERLALPIPVLSPPPANAPTNGPPAPSATSTANAPTRTAPVPSPSSVAQRPAQQPSALIADRTPVPPKPIHKIFPSTPTNLDDVRNTGADFSAGQTVDVEVSINERGEVIGAAVVGTTGAFAKLFEKNSIAAAHKWRFEPARIGGQAVPSKSTLNFRFAPRATR